MIEREKRVAEDAEDQAGEDHPLQSDGARERGQEQQAAQFRAHAAKAAVSGHVDSSG